MRVTTSRQTAGEKESEAHFERGRGNPDPDTDAADGCQVRKGQQETRKKQGHISNMRQRVTKGKQLSSHEGNGKEKFAIINAIKAEKKDSFDISSVRIQTLSNSSSVASGNFSWRLSFNTLEMKRIPYLTVRDRQRQIMKSNDAETEKCDVSEKRTEFYPLRR